MIQPKVVEVDDLVKVYPNGVRAVSNISFNIAPGEFIGLLGPNGSGKSTVIKILSTLIRKTSGKVMVAGYNIDQHPEAVRQHIGVALQDVGLDDLSTARDFLFLQGLLYGLNRNAARQKVNDLLELVGLTSVAGRKVGTYSGGMRRRIDLVSALMHDPVIIFLDEPTTGLDPQSRLNIWEYLRQLNRNGKTILLTTQLMQEADLLCRRIAILDLGKIVTAGTPEELKREVGGDIITVSIDSLNPSDRKAAIEKAGSIVKNLDYVLNTAALEDRLNITVREGGKVVADILRLLQDHRIIVSNLSLSGPTLDDVFLKYTGRNIRAEETAGGAANQAVRSLLRVGRR